MKQLTLLVLLFSIIFPRIGNSQSKWLEQGRGNSISLEIYKPFPPTDSIIFFPDGITPGFTPLSTTLFLIGRYNLTKNITLVGEVPFSNGDYDTTDFVIDEGGAKFGNPYIGAEYYVPESPIMLELGLRIPVLTAHPIYPSLVGFRADITRSAAWLLDVVPVRAGVNYESLSESNVYFRVGAGVNLWMSAKKAGFYSNTLVVTDYVLQLGYRSKYVHLLSGITGFYDSDTGPYEEDLNFAELGVMLSFPLKKITPGILFKVPITEDASDFIDYTVGLNCTYSL